VFDVVPRDVHQLLGQSSPRYQHRQLARSPTPSCGPDGEDRQISSFDEAYELSILDAATVPQCDRFGQSVPILDALWEVHEAPGLTAYSGSRLEGAAEILLDLSGVSSLKGWSFLQEMPDLPNACLVSVVPSMEDLQLEPQ
jgi:hypothetical protein